MGESQQQWPPPPRLSPPAPPALHEPPPCPPVSPPPPAVRAPEVQPNSTIVSPRLSCVLAREDLARGGPHFRATVARRLLAASAAAAPAPAGQQQLWVAWQARDEGRPFEASVIHRRAPWALGAPAAAAAPLATAAPLAAATADDDEEDAQLQLALAASLAPRSPDGGGGDGGRPRSPSRSSAGSGGSESSGGSAPSVATSQRTEAVEAALAAGEGERGTAIHGHHKGEPYELGAVWTETQMLACAVGPGSDEGALPGVLPGSGPVGLFRVVEYHFREVVWGGPPATAGVAAALADHLVGVSAGGAAPPPPKDVIVLLDAGRNIALALGPDAAYISCAGVHGVWGAFASGGWIGERA